MEPKDGPKNDEKTADEGPEHAGPYDRSNPVIPLN